jgi:hypothetical protein
MDWAKVRAAMERGLAPQISRTGKISRKQYVMYQAVCGLHRAQLHLDGTPAHWKLLARLAIEWIKKD